MKTFQQLAMALQVWLYRVSGGRLGGQMGGFRLLLLTVTGRKTGRARTVPLGYFDWPGGYLVVGSNGGAPTHPAWYLNLTRQPRVTLQVLDRVLSATAETLTGEARAQAWARVVATAPSYANYPKRTTRVIPVVLLRPDPT